MPIPADIRSTCERCGEPVRLAGPGKPDAELFKLATKANGVCASCVMTQFLYNTYPVNMIIDERGPEMLLHRAARDAVIACGILERGDLNIDEVNWRKLVANWNLPVKIHKDPRNPYRTGDSPRAKRKVVVR